MYRSNPSCLAYPLNIGSVYIAIYLMVFTFHRYINFKLAA